MNVKKNIKIFVDIMSVIFIAALPASLYKFDVYVHTHIGEKKIPMSAIFAIIDIIPTVFGIAWISSRYKKIGYFLLRFKEKHPKMNAFLMHVFYSFISYYFVGLPYWFVLVFIIHRFNDGYLQILRNHAGCAFPRHRRLRVMLSNV